MSQSAIIGTAEAAQILGWSIATVKRKAKSGEVSGTKMPGQTGAYLFDRDEIVAIAEGRSTAAAS